MMKLGKILALAFCGLSTLSCAANDDENTTKELDKVTVRNFPIIDGSDSTQPLRYILMCNLLGYDYKWGRDPFTQDPDAGIKRIYPHYTCTEEEQRFLRTERMFDSNTHPSFVNLIDGKVELILTARSISRDEKDYAEENGVTLIEKPIAKDALTFMVNPTNPVDNLTIPQIQSIYIGDITNWNEVGGREAPIVPYVRNRNSGSQEKFEALVMAGLTIKEFPEMHIGTTMMSPYYQLEDDVNGIAFTPYYYYSVIVDNGSTKALAVNGVEMSKANIMNNTYPYVSDVYAAVRSDIDKASMAYQIFEFLTTPKGQSIIEESGYVPLFASSASVQLPATDKETKVYCSHGVLYVNSSASSPKKISLISMDGKLVMEQKMNTNHIALPTHLMSDTYIVNVALENGSIISAKVRL